MQTRRRVRPIRLHPPILRNNQLQVRVEPGSAAKYLREGVMRANYGAFDLSQVAPAVLTLPVLGTVLTIAMAAGVPVEVDEVDDEFASGVEAMVPLWQELHPRFRTDGFELRARRELAPARKREGAVLLWSGGLDSTASLIEHAESVRALFTVWGADVRLRETELWRALNRHFDADGLASAVPRISARTTIRRFTITHTLVHDFLGPGESWWGRVQHGLALAGLAGPVTTALEVQTLIRAASFSADSNQPTGSMPVLDDLTRWAGVRVHHEGFELTRQDKITKRLAPYLAAGGRVNLAVCFRRDRHDADRGFNCGDCEKCIRTALGLVAAGIDPAEAGVRVPHEGHERWIRRLNDGLPLSRHQLPFWREIIDSVPSPTPAPADPRAAALLRALLADGSLVLTEPCTDVAGYRRAYWAKRRAVHLRRLRTRLGGLTKSARTMARRTKRGIRRALLPQRPASTAVGAEN